MDQQASTFYELRFRNQFLEFKGSAFQDLFVSIMSKIYPADFIPCRPWGAAGDRKNDGYLKTERTLFQVYAPNEMRASDAIKKIETDFLGALPYWKSYFDNWVFVHNTHGGLSPDVIAKLLELEQLHAPIKITHCGFDELVERFRLLSEDSLRSLYGSPPADSNKKQRNEIRTKLKFGEELVQSGKMSDGIREITEALAMARAQGDEEEEVEILVALALLSSERRGSGDRQHYFQLAEKKVDKLRSMVAKAIYFRARAGALEELRDHVGAEEAYRSALECCNGPEDEKGNLAMQGCVIRAGLVHLLCNQHRLDEARPILIECEKYAGNNAGAAEGEILLSALQAGIHFSLENGDEQGAVQRITELERSATTARLADRVGGELLNIANRASHRKNHIVALTAAECSVRLGQRCYSETAPNLLVGALYTEAMIIFKAGDADKALGKAEVIPDLCNRPEDSVIRQAAQHLIAEIKRVAGDSQTAVDLAQQALGDARGRPEEIAFTKFALARALSDNGQTEEALRQAKEAWTLLERTEVPAEAAIDLLFEIANYASQLGAEADTAKALNTLAELPDSSEHIKEEKARAAARVDMNQKLRERISDPPDVAEPDASASEERTNWSSLPEANAAVVEPLILWWKDIADAGPECIAGAYEFWGRGNFGRILRNAKAFPKSFNITLEVRSLEDVKRAIRIWGLYSDFLVLLWKGPTETAWNKIIAPMDFDAPGGLGYMMFLGTILKKEGSTRQWCLALGYGSTLPSDVTAFLATEALPFVRSGRLIVVPAVGVGCVSPGHGPFEQLLAESANAIPSVRLKGIAGTPLGYVPHSPDAPFEVLADLADTEAERLRKLRFLLLKRSQQLRPDGASDMDAKMLAIEIDDALRDLDDRNAAFARKRGLQKASEPLVGATARFRSGGKKLTKDAVNSPFAPLLILQNLGYGWRVDSATGSPSPSRFQPRPEEMIGGWLAPPTSGWSVPVLSEDTEESNPGS